MGPVPARWVGDDRSGAVVLEHPVRRVAPGQAVVLYSQGTDGDVVLGGGTARLEASGGTVTAAG